MNRNETQRIGFNSIEFESGDQLNWIPNWIELDSLLSQRERLSLRDFHCEFHFESKTLDWIGLDLIGADRKDWIGLNIQSLDE